MKVYVKKGEYQTPIYGIIGIIVFLAVPIAIFSSCFSYNNFIEMLEHMGIPLLFAMVFFAFALYFIYFLFKKPKGIEAKLVNKCIEYYKGKQITHMSFVVENDNVKTIYTCYTYGDNDLIENENYLIKIKEFNWKVKSIEELTALNDNNSKKQEITMVPVFFAIGFIIARINSI